MRVGMMLLASLAMVACNKNQEPSKNQADPSRVEAPPAVSSPVNAAPEAHAFAAPDSFKAGVGRIFTGYLNVQQALATDDFQKAKDAFSSMHGLIHTVPLNGLDSAAKVEWDSASARMMAVLHPMATSKDIEEMRGHFMAFTPQLADVLEKFGMQGPGPAYLFHCPMANGGKGADWLQKDKTKANPYEGKAMPECGSLVKEIKS